MAHHNEDGGQHLPHEWKLHAELTVSHPPLNPEQSIYDHNGRPFSGNFRATDGSTDASRSGGGGGGGGGGGVGAGYTRTVQSATGCRMTYDVRLPINTCQEGGNATSSDYRATSGGGSSSMGGWGDSSGYGSYEHRKRQDDGTMSACNIAFATNIREERFEKEKQSSFDKQHAPHFDCSNCYCCSQPHDKCSSSLSSSQLSDTVIPASVAEYYHQCHSNDDKNDCQYSRTLPPICFVKFRDACVQTLQWADKATSPFCSTLNLDSLSRQNSLVRVSHKNRLPSGGGGVRKRADEGGKSARTSTSGSNIGKKGAAPRTVHIDVYCTGTEMEESEDNDYVSSGETSSSTLNNHLDRMRSLELGMRRLYESPDVQITHARATDTQLPFNLRVYRRRSQSINSDNSYAAVPPNGALDTQNPSRVMLDSNEACQKDDYQSTEWQSTTFNSIDDLNFAAEDEHHVPTSSRLPTKTTRSSGWTVSTASNDSFEYADADDRVRIQQMEERIWRIHKSPVPVLRKQCLRNKALKNQMNKRHFVPSHSTPIQQQQPFDVDSDESTDDDDDDDLGTGWIFDDGDATTPTIASSSSTSSSICFIATTSPLSIHSFAKSPSMMAFQRRFDLDPSVRSPFTLTPGVYTDQRLIAKRFGAVVNVMRKPGHHIGPTKNPDCSCDHCYRHYHGNN